MNLDNPENWFLRKHEDGEVFGPVPFEKIREWAQSAQINPQDSVSNDRTVWTKAPMIPDFAMDWLVVMGEDLLYGPTTAEALIEFIQIGEITPDTVVINCVNGERTSINMTGFYQKHPHPVRPRQEDPAEALLGLHPQPVKGSIRVNLQKRIRELEIALMEERRIQSLAEDTIARLEHRVKELEARIREYSGFKSS